MDLQYHIQDAQERISRLDDIQERLLRLMVSMLEVARQQNIIQTACHIRKFDKAVLKKAAACKAILPSRAESTSGLEITGLAQPRDLQEEEEEEEDIDDMGPNIESMEARVVKVEAIIRKQVIMVEAMRGVMITIHGDAGKDALEEAERKVDAGEGILKLITDVEQEALSGWA